MSVPPATIVSFVRHAHVSSVFNVERTSGLSHHGCRGAARVTVRLADLADAVATSPAERVRVTIEGVVGAADAPLIVDDDLREHEPADSPIENFDEVVEHLWVNPNASHPGGESHAEVQVRGVAAVDRLVETYPDRHIVVGTHATFMVLALNAYDPRYGREFWMGLTTPGAYEVTFVDSEVLSIVRTQTSEKITREGDADCDSAER